MLVKKSLLVLIIKLVGVLCQFIAVFIITNNAEEEIYGKYSFLNSIIILLGALCLLGMNNSFLQFSGKLMAQKRFYQIKILYKKNFVILTFSFITILSAFLILKYLLKIPYLNNKEIDGIYTYAILILFPYAVTVLNSQVLRGLNKLFLSEFTSNIIRFGGLLVLVIVLYWSSAFNYLLEGYFTLFVVTAIISTALIYPSFKNLKPPVRSSIKGLGYRKIARISIPMSFSLISLLLMQSFDVFMIERFWDFEQVAYYSAAIKITTGIGLILATINSVIAPDLARLFFSKDYQGLKKLVEHSAMLNFFMTLPFILGVYFLSEVILGFFGNNYVVANTALKIMVVAQMLNVFCGSVGYYLNMTGKEDIYLKILLIALAINIILNLVLIPKYGLSGAAIATGISLIFWNMSGAIYIFRKDKIGVFIFSKYFHKDN